MKRLAALLLFIWAAAAAADQSAGITADVASVEAIHQGKPVRIQREQDNLNQIDPDFALTSRPSPPFCIQPMHLAPDVETIGELELLDFLQRIGGRDQSVLVIDSRDEEWLVRSGIIPSAIHLPWQRLHPRHADPESIAEILELQFGARRAGALWNFENAKTLVSTATAPGAASRRPTSGSCSRSVIQHTCSSGTAAAGRCGRG